MARKAKELGALEIGRLTTPGLHSVGGVARRFNKLRTYLFLIRNNLNVNPKHIWYYFKFALKAWLLHDEIRRQFTQLYGSFNWDRDCRPHRILNPGSEGGAILGEVIVMASGVDVADGAIFLAGDRNDVKALWNPIFPHAKFITAGIHEMDYLWDYENDPPPELQVRRFKLIISNATLEHLINPYKHVCDLASLLDEGGFLLLNTVLPGFFYHRVPIDCYRFYPDFFEVMAKKLGLEVIEKQITVFNITYKLRRPVHIGSKAQ